MPEPARDPLEALARGIRALIGRSPTREEREQFRRYLDLLLRWNRTHHLTALRSPEALARGLFLDSLLFLSQLPPRPLTMADIGAGAGIPGVPLRIVEPGIALTLVESRRKPVSFLLALRRELKAPDIQVFEGRAEHLVTEVPELYTEFDVVVSRAVGDVEELIRVAWKYLKPGGLFLTSGPPAGKIRQSAPQAAQWRTVPFPSLGLTRVFLVARKPA